MGNSRKKKHSKKHSSVQMVSAAMYVTQWASLCRSPKDALSCANFALEDWIPAHRASPSGKAPIVDLHTHSSCSDGMLSPTQLVEKAMGGGVQVLALTDHDTMVGIPAALEATNKLGIRLIPGVEISAKFASRVKNGVEDNVHILGYYSCCGPSRWLDLEKVLLRIREGRYQRAETIINKLKMLKKPVTWERVISLAGTGVAPGRMHVARALVEAGHVETVREAFNKYLYDGGPAYASGYELAAEDAVRLVCDTGGFATLAHPWALKEPVAVVKQLKAAGLHAMEVYRGDGKASGFADLADIYGLVKLGGSDFHGRGDPDEVKLGKVALPLLTVSEFLRVAGPLWLSAIKDILQCFAKETFEVRADKIVGLKYFSDPETRKGDISLNFSVMDGRHIAILRLSPWLTDEERLAAQEVLEQLKLKYEAVAENGKTTLYVSQQIV